MAACLYSTEEASEMLFRNNTRTLAFDSCLAVGSLGNRPRLSSSKSSLAFSSHAYHHLREMRHHFWTLRSKALLKLCSPFFCFMGVVVRKGSQAQLKSAQSDQRWIAHPSQPAFSHKVSLATFIFEVYMFNLPRFFRGQVALRHILF